MEFSHRNQNFELYLHSIFQESLEVAHKFAQKLIVQLKLISRFFSSSFESSIIYYNVRRYVQLPCIAVACVFAGKLRNWIILVIYLFIALAKTMTPQWEPTATAVAAWPATAYSHLIIPTCYQQFISKLFLLFGPTILY